MFVAVVAQCLLGQGGAGGTHRDGRKRAEKVTKGQGKMKALSNHNYKQKTKN